MLHNFFFLLQKSQQERMKAAFLKWRLILGSVFLWNLSAVISRKEQCPSAYTSYGHPPPTPPIFNQYRFTLTLLLEKIKFYSLLKMVTSPCTSGKDCRWKDALVTLLVLVGSAIVPLASPVIYSKNPVWPIIILSYKINYILS